MYRRDDTDFSKTWGFDLEKMEKKEISIIDVRKLTPKMSFCIEGNIYKKWYSEGNDPLHIRCMAIKIMPLC